MDPYLQELFARPNDFQLTNELFLRISHNFDESDVAQLNALSTPQRTLLNVYGSKGVIDNGGFRYLLEGDLAELPAMAESYQRIGAVKQADLFCKILSYFPDQETLGDYDRRIAFIENNEDTIPWEEISEQFFMSGAICERKLAAYVRANQAAYDGLTSAYPKQVANELAALADKDLPPPLLEADSQAIEKWLHSIDVRTTRRGERREDYQDAPLPDERDPIVELRFSDHRNSTDRDLLQAIQYPALGEVRALSLTNTNLGQPGLQAIEKFRKLERLDLSRTDTMDNWLPDWRNLPQLRELDLSHTKVTDRALQQVEALPSLRHLILSRLRLTSRGYASLRRLPLAFLMAMDSELTTLRWPRLARCRRSDDSTYGVRRFPGRVSPAWARSPNCAISIWTGRKSRGNGDFRHFRNWNRCNSVRPASTTRPFWSLPR